VQLAAAQAQVPTISAIYKRIEQETEVSHRAMLASAGLLQSIRKRRRFRNAGWVTKSSRLRSQTLATCFGNEAQFDRRIFCTLLKTPGILIGATTNGISLWKLRQLGIRR
jgi:hypothetical protein